MYFLTGPVRISETVKMAFMQDPISHRSPLFEERYTKIKNKLVQLTRSKDVILLNGSGTLANEAIGQQLKCLSLKGLILSNGEFGNRLKSQANNAGIRYDHLTIEYGEMFSQEEIEKILSINEYSWVWMVIHETSTGIWNDYLNIAKLAKKYNCLMAVDAVSAFATAPLDFSIIDFASGSSGKAIGSYPGISMVWHNNNFATVIDTPMYLDLGYYAQFKHPPFTTNSNLIAALHTSLDEFNPTIDYDNIAQITIQLKNFIKSMGWNIVNEKDQYSNNITISLPDNICSEKFGDILYENNCWVGYKSGYLKKLNWIQFYITKNNTIEDLEDLRLLFDTKSIKEFVTKIDFNKTALCNAV